MLISHPTVNQFDAFLQSMEYFNPVDCLYMFVHM